MDEEEEYNLVEATLAKLVYKIADVILWEKCLKLAFIVGLNDKDGGHSRLLSKFFLPTRSLFIFCDKDIW